MTTTSDAPLGEVLRDGERRGLRFVRHLAHPPETVWRAITESEQLRHWLPCDIVGERREGAALVLPFWPVHVQRYAIPADQAELTGEIRVWDPPHVFEWTWDVDVLRFELAPSGAETRLVFTTWIGKSEDHDYPPASTAAGYHVCLDQLVELVGTGSVRVGLVDRPTKDWEQRYAAVVGEGASPRLALGRDPLLRG